MATDPAVQAAAQALCDDGCDVAAGGDTCDWDRCLSDAALVVAAVTPLIRAQAFTEAADMLLAEAEKVRVGQHLNTTKAQANHHGRVKGLDHAVALVRGLAEETASVDSKINTT